MIFCADDFNMGAMENKGLNIFNSRLVLADPATATDDDYAAIEGVIGHEYFHNWTGNRVTCRDWFQLSLKEGLTVFRDQEFSSDLNSRAVERIARGRVPAPRAVPGGRGPDGAQRAARRVSRDQQLLHRHRLREGRRGHPHAAHAARPGALPPRHGPLLRAPRRHGGDLRRLRAGDAGRVGRRPRAVPALVLRRRARPWSPCAARTTPPRRPTRSTSRSARRPRRASRDKLPFHIPFAVGLRRPRRPRHPAAARRRSGAGRHDARARARARRAQSFRFAGIDAPPVPSLLRGFSAPVKVDYRLYATTSSPSSPAHDSDAGRSLGRGAAQLRQRDACARARSPRRAAAGAAAIARAASSSKLLADRVSDPALHRARAGAARCGVRRGAGAGHRRRRRRGGARVPPARARHARCAAQFERVYHERRVRALVCADATTRPARAGSPTCACAIWARVDDAAARALAVAHFDSADNMTDTFAALVGAEGRRHAGARRAVRALRGAAGATSRWCSTSGSRSRRWPSAPDTLDARRRRCSRIRASMRAIRIACARWSARSRCAISRASTPRDGRGYAFAADQVLALDATNPQLAATVAGAFNLWKRFAQPRRGLMQAALQRIAARAGAVARRHGSRDADAAAA